MHTEASGGHSLEASGTSIPVLLLCLGTNHRTLHRQTDLMVTQRHGNCPVQQLGFFGGVQSLTKSEGLYGKDAKTRICRLVWWPYLKQSSLCPPISSLSNQVFPGRVHLSMQVLQACQYHEEWKEPQGRSVLFSPHQR